VSNETYDIYFSGKLMKDSNPEQVKRKIGVMFKLEGKGLEKLFSGKSIPIKKGVEMDRAIKYRVAFRDAGGLVDIVPAGEPPPTAKPSPKSRPTAERPDEEQPQVESSPDKTHLDLAEQTPLESSAALSVPKIPIPNYGLSDAKEFDLSDCNPEVTPQAIPDISALELNKPGITLDNSLEPEPLEIDTTELSLDAPGVTLINEPATQAPKINTEDLTLNPANEGSLEAYQTPVEAVPLPNIDHLKIAAAAAANEDKSEGKAKFTLPDDDD
jgi:hypothetical protein